MSRFPTTLLQGAGYRLCLRAAAAPPAIDLLLDGALIGRLTDAAAAARLVACLGTPAPPEPEPEPPPPGAPYLRVVR